jgi:hypothetical protein
MKLTVYRIGDCMLFKEHRLDGYVCQSISRESPSPSEILSKYLEKAVHLVQKGPERRPVEPTLSFPNLTASAIFQDGFPLLVASEESLQRIGDLINEFVGGGRLRGNVDPGWAEGRIEMRRFVYCSFVLDLIGIRLSIAGLDLIL